MAPFPNLRCHTPPLSPPGRGNHGEVPWGLRFHGGKKIRLFRQLFSKWNRISYQIRKVPLSTFGFQTSESNRLVVGPNHSIYNAIQHSIFTNIPFPNEQQLKQPLPFVRQAWHLQWLPKSVSCSCQNHSRHSPWPQQHTKHRQRHLSAPILHTKGGVLHPDLIPWVYLTFFLKCFFVESTSCRGSLSPTTVAAKAGTARRRPKLIESPNGNDSRGITESLSFQFHTSFVEARPWDFRSDL